MKNMTGHNAKNWVCVIETLWATFSSLQPMKTQQENSQRMTVAEKLSPRYYNVERFLIYCRWKVSIVPSNKNLWSHMGVKYFFFNFSRNAKFTVSALGVKSFTLFVMAGLHLCWNLFLQPSNQNWISHTDSLCLSGCRTIAPNTKRDELHTRGLHVSLWV